MTEDGCTKWQKYYFSKRVMQNDTDHLAFISNNTNAVEVPIQYEG